MNARIISFTALGMALLALGGFPGNASAQSTAHTTQAAKANQNRQAKLNHAFSQVNINRVAALDASTNQFFIGGPTDQVTAKLPHLYKTTRAFKVTNEFNHKLATLPAGTVVQAIADNDNVHHFSFETLNTNKQRLIQQRLGNVAGLHFVDSNNGIAQHPYTKTTAFAYHGSASLPTLHQIKGGLLRSSTYQVQITANNYLTSSAGALRSAKIKQFKRTASSITLYLNKPLAGVPTTRVRVHHVPLYRAKLTIGHVFLDYDYSDPVGYGLTINVNGKAQLGFDMSALANPYAAQIAGTNGDWAYGYTASQVAQSQAFVTGLYSSNN